MVVVGVDAGEQVGGGAVAAVRGLGQVQVRHVARPHAQDVGGGAVLGPAKGHVVGLRRQALVGLTRQREARRVRHAAGEDRRQHHAPTLVGEPRERPPRAEGGVVQVRRKEHGGRHGVSF